MKTIQQICWVGLAAIAIGTVLSCDKQKDGVFYVEVQFSGTKPTNSCWVFAELRQLQRDGSATSVRKLPQVQYEPSVEGHVTLSTDNTEVSDTDSAVDTESTVAPDEVALDFQDVDFGDDYVVVIFLKDGVEADANLLYAGMSDSFSLREGTDAHLPVVLSKAKLSIIGQQPKNVSHSSTVDVALAIDSAMFAGFEAETEVLLSNNPDDFENAASIPLSEAKTSANGYFFRQWDLNDRVCVDSAACPRGERAVYARIINPVFGDDDLNLEVDIWLDDDRPRLKSFEPKLPEYTQTNLETVLVFSEPVEVASLAVDCDGFGAPVITLVTGGEPVLGKEVGTTFGVVCPLGQNTPNRTHTISVTASDPSGQSTGNIVLGKVTVDTVLPDLVADAEGNKIHYNNPPLINSDSLENGDSLRIEFTLMEPVADLAVVLGTRYLTDTCRVNLGNRLNYICEYKPEASDSEGIFTIGVFLTDAAGNTASFFSKESIRFDFTRPTITSWSVQPDIARDGIEVTVDIVFSEVPSSLAFNWDHLVLKDSTVETLPDEPNHYRVTFVVSENDENRTYNFSLYCADAAGNTCGEDDDGTSSIGSLTIDTRPPELLPIGDKGEQIVVDQESVTLDEAFSFRFRPSEPLVDFDVVVGLVPLNVGSECDIVDEYNTYQCTHTISRGESEGPKDITVIMQDLAGNRGTGYRRNAIVSNYEYPAVRRLAIAPSTARIGDTVVILASFSEPVSQVKMNWDGLPGVSDPDSNQTGSDFLFAVDIDSSFRGDGVFDIAVASAVDRFGQPVENAGATQRLVVDVTLPEVENNQIDIVNSLVRNGDWFYLSFWVTEPLQDLSVFVDDEELDGSFQGNCDAYYLVCDFSHYAQYALEEDGAKRITIEMTDLAGNRHTQTFDGFLTYDFEDPFITDGSTIKPTRAKDGDKIELRLVFSEAIAYDGAQIYARGQYTSDYLEFDPVSMVGTNAMVFTTSHVITDEDAQDVYDVWLSNVQDMAGNYISNLRTDLTFTVSRTVYVDNDSYGGDGVTWGSAYNTLQDAVDNALSGNEIWVATTNRSYQLPGDLEAADPRNTTFALNRNLRIYGGFQGNEISIEERDENAADRMAHPEYYGSPEWRAVLDGNLSNDYLQGQSAYHVVTVTGDVYLDGFVITHGNADGERPQDKVGGGVTVEKGELTLSNCIIEDNYADTKGGGVYAYMSDVSLKNSDVVNNRAGLRGGGIYGTSSDIISHNTTYSQNVALEGLGGAIRAEDTRVAIFNNVFFDNFAMADNSGAAGGALSTWGSEEIEVGFSTFVYLDDDEAQSGGLSGNMMYFGDNNADNIKLSNSVLWSDTAFQACQIRTNSVSGMVPVDGLHMPDCEVSSGVECSTHGNCIDSNVSSPGFENLDGDAGTISLRLTEGSPDIDQVSCNGIVLPKDVLDIDGDDSVNDRLDWDLDSNARCQSTTEAADLGAYEFSDH